MFFCDKISLGVFVYFHFWINMWDFLLLNHMLLWGGKVDLIHFLSELSSESYVILISILMLHPQISVFEITLCRRCCFWFLSRRGSANGHDFKKHDLIPTVLLEGCSDWPTCGQATLGRSPCLQRERKASLQNVCIKREPRKFSRTMLCYAFLMSE